MMSQSLSQSHWQDYLNEHKARFEVELLDFLRIPSISSLPEHAPDVMRAGQWVADRLVKAGLENVKLMPTDGHPVVYADWLHAAGKPTILIYGHFDVQPVDPLHLWHSPPFEPVIKDGKVYARGASDDKGNMLVPVLVLESMLKTSGQLPVNIKIFFEGQEEIGSPQLPDFIAEHKEMLACDVAISADSGQYSETEGMLLMGLKGLCALQIDLKGANSDLHSGIYGGAVQNPLHALSHILASMRGDDGRILVEGFYDDVKDLSAEERSDIAKVPFDEANYKAALNVKELFGEDGYSTLERAWARPTLEVNGIWGGFQGAGGKTVLPNEAHAKITCRLVANQDPQKIQKLVEICIYKHLLPGVGGECEFEQKAQPSPISSDPIIPTIKKQLKVLKEFYGKTLIMCGWVAVCLFVEFSCVH
ncbi:MAG: dipeptidase [Deinococcales bacterium]